MIILRLKGALGNQMFEYAFGRTLSIKHNVPLKLDITGLNSTLHNCSFDLQHFNISADIANIREISHFNRTSLPGISRLALDRFLPRNRRFVITERTFEFEENLLDAGNNIYLQGYWQSEKYFESIKDTIRKELTIKYKPDNLNKKYIDDIKAVNAVSLHVRRGDYTSVKHVAETHGTCSLEYYRKCIDFISNNVSDPHYFIFSDDIDWARDNIKIDHPTIYFDHNGSNIEHGGTEKCYEDIRLMSCCNHHIIANSSFSWWGAWLNPDQQKIVCAPDKWAINEALNTKNRIPEGWNRF